MELRYWWAPDEELDKRNLRTPGRHKGRNVSGHNDEWFGHLLGLRPGMQAGHQGRHLKDVTGLSYHGFRRQGVAYLPAARLEQGLVAGLSLADHFVLSEGTRGVFIDRARAADVAADRICTYNIKGSPSHRVESLSGGNQQRMLLALLRDSLSLILLEHPTRGLDIESTLYIWTRLRERCAQGSAIVFISADLEEILMYSDRVLVFFAGRVSPPLPVTGLSVEKLGGLIGGKGWDAPAAEAAAHD